MEKMDGASFWDFKGEGEYTDSKFLMSTPFPIAMTLVAYLWFVLKIGPELMKTRKPFHLTNTILAYNIAQVLISCHIFQSGFRFIYRFGIWDTTCNIENKEVEENIMDAAHYYFLAKIIELLDTIFFVLRKKQRQVTFLHVYHHTIMVICTWSIVKYIKNDSTVFFASINSLVHVVMYAYYTLSVFPTLTKYLWWKKYITMMQLVQFCLMFVHMVWTHVISECKPTYYLLTCVCFNTVFFLFLFGDFYIKSYNTSKIATKTCTEKSCEDELGTCKDQTVTCKDESRTSEDESGTCEDKSKDRKVEPIYTYRSPPYRTGSVLHATFSHRADG